jgi:hypothetical protein
VKCGRILLEGILHHGNVIVLEYKKCGHIPHS